MKLLMNNPRRWHELVKQSISPPNLSFEYIKSVSVVSVLGQYTSTSQKEFREILQRISHNDHNELINVIYKPNMRKIKKEVQSIVEPLFEKYFSVRSTD